MKRPFRIKLPALAAVALLTLLAVVGMLALWGGESDLVVQLEDHPAAQAFYEMLPLELNFSDYNRTEKITYLEEELPTEGSPDNCDPEVGDLCYYIPWGNLCFFYEDFRQSESLVPLGSIVSGEELLEQLDKARSVLAEAVDE